MDELKNISIFYKYKVVIKYILLLISFISFFAFVYYVAVPFTKIKTVKINGVHKVDFNGVLNAVDLKNKVNLFDIDLQTTINKIKNLKWVKNAIVSKNYPDTIIIKIIEYKPSILVQNKQRFMLLNKDGIPITLLSSPVGYLNLPLFVSPLKNYDNIINLLKTTRKYKEIYNKIYAYVFVHSRRWDIQTKTNTIIKLPQDNLEYAWERLKKYNEKYNIISDKIKVIDLRYKDKLILEPIVKDSNE